MAIRDRFRRALRKSVSAGAGVIRHTDTTLTMESNTSNDSEQSDFSMSPKRHSFFSRAFTWGTTRRSSRADAGGNSSAGDNSDSNEAGIMSLPQQIDLTLTRTASEAEREMKAEKKRQRKAKYKNAGKMHPRDKPLTAQNLRHQAMLGTWSWDDGFGGGMGEGEGNPRHSFVSGVSPCCTRPASLRGDDDDYFENGGDHARSSNTLGGAMLMLAPEAAMAPRERRTAVVMHGAAPGEGLEY